MRHLTWRSISTWLVETAIIVTALAYVLTGQDRFMLLWELLGGCYLAVGAVLAWRASEPAGDGGARLRRAPVAGTWVLPLLSSVVGLMCAVTALQARANASKDELELVMAVVASVGVIVSWLLLHTGFADVYERACSTRPGALEFPATTTPAHGDYLYFAITVGTSFATSDVTVTSPLVRRVVVIHGVVSFFFNAFVVAVALQVLQQLLGG